MYLYETHMHTCQGSACGTSTGAEHARFYKQQGYQGIFITDHFFGGNTAAPRTGKWKDRIDHYCSGFEDAWNEGQKIGLFHNTSGEEISYDLSECKDLDGYAFSALCDYIGAGTAKLEGTILTVGPYTSVILH
jgi:histidinol phosphatase-like PHP family hydrolase